VNSPAGRLQNLDAWPKEAAAAASFCRETNIDKFQLAQLSSWKGQWGEKAKLCKFSEHGPPRYYAQLAVGQITPLKLGFMLQSSDGQKHACVV